MSTELRMDDGALMILEDQFLAAHDDLTYLRQRVIGGQLEEADTWLERLRERLDLAEKFIEVLRRRRSHTTRPTGAAVSIPPSAPQ